MDFIEAVQTMKGGKKVLRKEVASMKIETKRMKKDNNPLEVEINKDEIEAEYGYELEEE